MHFNHGAATRSGTLTNSTSVTLDAGAVAVAEAEVRLLMSEPEAEVATPKRSRVKNPLEATTP